MQTLYHWLSIIVSVLLYFVFALIYNGACVDCMDLNNIPFWVMQHSMGTVQFWSICLLAAVLALLPRYIESCVKAVLLSSENHLHNVPLPSLKIHCVAIFQPAIPET